MPRPSRLLLVDIRTHVRPAVGITDRGPVTVKTAGSASETGVDPLKGAPSTAVMTTNVTRFTMDVR